MKEGNDAMHTVVKIPQPTGLVNPVVRSLATMSPEVVNRVRLGNAVRTSHPTKLR
jgi:hypothetical protein